MHQKKTLEGIEELICDFHFFICHAFYAFQKTEGWSVDLMKKTLSTFKDDFEYDKHVIWRGHAAL